MVKKAVWLVKTFIKSEPVLNSLLNIIGYKLKLYDIVRKSYFQYISASISETL